MTGMLTLESLETEVSAGRIDTVVACFPDLFGRLLGKRFDASFFLESGCRETHACDYLLACDMDMEPVPGYAAASWDQGYGDFVLKPDIATLRVLPWLDGTALVLCDVQDHHGEALGHSPRVILQGQIKRLEALGLQAMVASELEFYVFDETYREIAERGFQSPRTGGRYIEDYHIFQTTKEEPLLRAMRKGLQAAGIPVENSKGEWGPGQEELNIRYADALSMADRHVIMKNGMKEIAHGQGKAITFMPKWNYELAGSSCHVHLSLWEGGEPAFFDENSVLGMSPLMCRFMAGQLKYSSDITYFLAPFINSYKRFQSKSFAPTRAVWSRDNRTAGFRLCGEKSRSIRCECRIGGADLNPYLAFSGLIAAGLAGVEEDLELAAPHLGDAYADVDLPEIPKTLRDAASAFRASTMLRSALGNEVVDHYAHTADWEQLEYDRRVTDWELRRGFERS
jgi:glutamine synthetase